MIMLLDFLECVTYFLNNNSYLLIIFCSDADSLEKRTGNPSYVYDYAANLGRTSRDTRTCAQHFSSCSDPPQALNEFMNEVFTQEMCDSSALFSKSNDNTHHSNNYSHL